MGQDVELKPGEAYKLTHNTLIEAARIVFAASVSVLIALLSVPWRLLRGMKP